MSDGAFRDDQEAALARAEALEEELARAKQENAELKQTAERLEHEKDAEHRRADAAERKIEKPKPKPKRVKERVPAGADSPRKTIAIGIGVAVAILAITFGIPMCIDRRQARHRREGDRWEALVEIPRCVRQGLAADPVMKQTPEAQDPRTNQNAHAPTWNGVDGKCDVRIDLLGNMDAFAGEASDLQRWRQSLVAVSATETALNDYYQHKDWKDDAYRSGPAKWQAAQAAATAEHAAAGVVADRLLAIDEAELRRYQRAYEDGAGKDSTWWLLELGIQLQVAADDWLRGDRVKAQAEYDALDGAATAAPLDVRRVVRERSYKLDDHYFKNELLRAVKGIP